MIDIQYQEMKGIIMSVGKTIFAQIKAIDPMALFAWGAKDMVAMNDGFKFKTSGMVKWKGYVYIKYDHNNDLYDVIFAKIKKYEWVEEKTVCGVYCDQLVSVIDSKVQ